VSDFTDLIDLASERLGGAVIAANDEFFAPKENLVREAAPIWREGAYTDRGKWMDGWETRRRREPGFDWCLVRLGLPGVVRGLVVDTAHFRGNYPEACSVEACEADGAADPLPLAADRKRWREIVPRSPLRGDARNLLAVEDGGRVTHLRLNIYPDGGVARLRVHGEVAVDWERLSGGGAVDLASVEHGGYVIACSDMFFGHRQNLIMPGRSRSMADGWETRRRRGPGHDWCIIRLGASGAIARIEVDTDHFKGNAPDRCSLEGCSAPGATAEQLAGAEARWTSILGESKLQPHARHVFERELAGGGPFSHVRFNIYPDGGVARLRLFGTATGPAR
jgi:allantoicase